MDEPAGAPDLPLEQMAALERVMARYYRFYVLFGGFGAAYREEAEPPEVDAVERYRVAEGVARGAQEGPVAAEDYREGRLFAPRLVVYAGDGDGGRLVRREEEAYPFVPPPVPEPPRRFDGFGLLRVKEQSYLSSFALLLRLGCCAACACASSTILRKSGRAPPREAALCFRKNRNSMLPSGPRIGE